MSPGLSSSGGLLVPLVAWAGLARRSLGFDVSPPGSVGRFWPFDGDISSLFPDLSSGVSPPALLAEAEAAAELELALAIGVVGSAAGLDIAGVKPTGAPAVGRLGATSPVGEYHNSVTMSRSSISGALTISSPKLGSMGSDLMTFPVLNSLVTLHQTWSQLGPSGKVPFMYLACLSRRANTLKSHLNIRKGSWCLLQTLLAFDRWSRHRSLLYVGQLANCLLLHGVNAPSSLGMLEYGELQCFFFQSLWHHKLDTQRCIRACPNHAWWCTSVSKLSSTFPPALAVREVVDLPQQCEEVELHPSLLLGGPKGLQWLTSMFRCHICLQHFFCEYFAQWKHLKHFPRSSPWCCPWLQEKCLGAILLRTCDLFWETRLSLQKVVVTLSTHDHVVLSMVSFHLWLQEICGTDCKWCWRARPSKSKRDDHLESFFHSLSPEHSLESWIETQQFELLFRFPLWTLKHLWGLSPKLTLFQNHSWLPQLRSWVLALGHNAWPSLGNPTS